MRLKTEVRTVSVESFTIEYEAQVALQLLVSRQEYLLAIIYMASLSKCGHTVARGLVRDFVDTFWLGSAEAVQGHLDALDKLGEG